MGVFAKAAACAVLVGLASAQCTVSDGAHTFDLSTIPFAGALYINQVIAGNPGLDGYYTWAVSLCTPVAPTGGKSCNKAATSYAFVYPVGVGSCTAAMNMPVAPWSWDAGKNAATRTFNGQGVRAVIDITCDPNADTLTVNGNAPTTNDANTWVWNLKLKSKAVCAAGPGPNPTPTTPAPTMAPAPAPAPGPYGFHYCNALSPAKAEVRGQTAKPIAIVDGVGSKVTCPCLTVASNTTAATLIKLAVACAASPQGPFATVQELPKMAGYSAAAPVTAECPVRGYFAIVAWNPSSATAKLDYGAKCVVSD